MNHSGGVVENFIYSPSGENTRGIILGVTQRSNFAGIVFISFARNFPSPSSVMFFFYRRKMISFENWARWTAVKWSDGSSFVPRSRNETVFASARDRRTYRSHRRPPRREELFSLRAFIRAFSHRATRHFGSREHVHK